MAANGTQRQPHAGGGSRYRHQKHVLFPERAADVVANLGVDAAGTRGVEQRLRPRRLAAVVFAEHHALERAGLHDDAGAADRGCHVGGAAHHRAGAENSAQHVVLLHAVLQRDDAGVRPHDRLERLRRAFGVPQFDGEQHDVDRADLLRIVGDVDLGQADRIVRALDREAVLAHGCKMRAAGDEVHVGAALLELGAEITADAARSHDGNAQRYSPEKKARPLTGWRPYKVTPGRTGQPSSSAAAMARRSAGGITIAPMRKNALALMAMPSRRNAVSQRMVASEPVTERFGPRSTPISTARITGSAA